MGPGLRLGAIQPRRLAAERKNPCPAGFFTFIAIKKSHPALGWLFFTQNSGSSPVIGSTTSGISGSNARQV